MEYWKVKLADGGEVMPHPQTLAEFIRMRTRHDNAQAEIARPTAEIARLTAERDALAAELASARAETAAAKEGRYVEVPNIDEFVAERIVAAAIQIEGLTISLPQPARHGHVHMACDAAHIPVEVYMRGTQGFLTSTGRFVNRVMAKHIAQRAGQPQMRPAEDRCQRDLFSEDLW